MRRGGLLAAPQMVTPPAPCTQGCSAHASLPKLQHQQPTSQSRQLRWLLSPFQCNHVPRCCSLSCSCDLHFFFPSCVTLHEDVFQPTQVFQAECPTRPASCQHQPCSFHLSVHVPFQTELDSGAGGFSSGYFTYTAQLITHPQLERGRRRRQLEARRLRGELAKVSIATEDPKTTWALQRW